VVVAAAAMAITMASVASHPRHVPAIVRVNQHGPGIDPWPALIVSVQSMQFDQGRAETVVQFVQSNRERLTSAPKLDSERLEQIIDEFEFDQGRQRAITALGPYVSH
jgi:hypothetical protein